MSYAKMCLDCKRICDEDEVFIRQDAERENFWGEPFFRTVSYECCPYCGYDELIEVHLCEKCELNETKEHEEWCYECLGKYARPNPLDPWMDAMSQELKEMGP